MMDRIIKRFQHTIPNKGFILIQSLFLLFYLTIPIIGTAISYHFLTFMGYQSSQLWLIFDILFFKSHLFYHKQMIDQQFRKYPTTLSLSEISTMLKAHHFYETKLNPNGTGFENQFQLKIIHHDTIIIDKAAGLIWQRSGSLQNMSIEDAYQWIQSLNHSQFAGYQDWRLPSLEEAMSLMEPERLNHNLYIHPLFSQTQWVIWTSDRVPDQTWPWKVYFDLADCNDYPFYDDGSFVRAVRTIKESEALRTEINFYLKL